MKIKKSVKLSKYCSFRTGGNARFFCIVKNLSDLKKAISFSKENKIKFFILGGGSNVLINDAGFSGLVIKNEILCKEVFSRGIISFGAGEKWDGCVLFSIKNNLFGLENLSYIPGTVGGSAVQNIGAYGAEAKDFILKVEVYDVVSGEVFQLKNKDCNFSYRNSIFKNNKNLIITKVYFSLDKKFKANLNYSGIVEKIEENSQKKRKNIKREVTAIDVRNAVISIRKSKLPEVSELGSAGSFFKNPVLDRKDLKKIQNIHPDIKFFSGKGAEKGKFKISLSYILDKICNLKGFRKGTVGFYNNQSLVIVNFGKANTKEILELAEIAEKKVKEKIGIKIQMEVEKI
ncbi:MAG: UDP-N-acetylmuramate dehydrogenase [Minisyncoccia bacterium]